MERKIGEIFEYNSEWYQCVESDGTCNGCVGTFQSYSLCNEFDECVGKIFKKLEKVGEPYSDYCPSGRIICFQRYKCYQKPIYTGNFICWADDINISIEIKQTKEDMEEKKQKLDKLVDDYMACRIQYAEFDKGIKALYDKEESEPTLKEFDLEAAKAGKPVCTRDGAKARIICFDAKSDAPIIALITTDDGTEIAFDYLSDGTFFNSENPDNDLIMLPEKKEGWVNVYRDCDGANITKDDNIYSSKDAAIGSAQVIDRDNYVATTKINWEE